MILTELTGIKTISQQTLGEFIRTLVQQRKINVHAGSFAFVINPKDLDYVFKVWIDDKGWETYLEYAQQHPNKHILKTIGRIHEIPMTFARPKDFDATFKVIRVEKLKNITDQRLMHEINALGYVDMVDIVTENGTVEDVIEAVEDVILASSDTEDSFIELLAPKSFYQAVLDLHSAGHYLHNDMKDDNVMHRADGTLVIVDPFFDDVPELMITASTLLQSQYQNRPLKSGRSSQLARSPKFAK